MKVVYKSNTGEDILADLSVSFPNYYSAKSEFSLTRNKEYCVYGIKYLRRAPFVLICNDAFNAGWNMLP